MPKVGTFCIRQTQAQYIPNTFQTQYILLYQSGCANFSSSTSKAFLACFNSSFIDNNSVQRFSFGRSYQHIYEYKTISNLSSLHGSNLFLILVKKKVLFESRTRNLRSIAFPSLMQYLELYAPTITNNHISTMYIKRLKI